MMIQKQNISFELESSRLLAFSLTMKVDGEIAGSAFFELTLNEGFWLDALSYDDFTSFENSEKSWLFDINVNDRFQGQGLARKLLAQLENCVLAINEILETNISLKATVNADGGLTQDDLIAFYQRYGFDLNSENSGIVIEKSCTENEEFLVQNIDFCALVKIDHVLERVSS